MLDTVVVVLDVTLLIVAALGAIIAASIETKNEKGWWLMVFGLFILALGHVTETLFGEVFYMSHQVNEIQHRLWVLSGFITIIFGIFLIRRSRMAEKTDEEAKKESAKESKISSGKAELSSAGKAELSSAGKAELSSVGKAEISSAGRQFSKFVNSLSNFIF